MAICVAAIAIIGVGNYFVVMFRSNPIVPWDIYSFETAMSVADNYVFSVDWALAEHIAMFILMLIVGVRTNIRLNKKILLSDSYCGYVYSGLFLYFIFMAG